MQLIFFIFLFIQFVSLVSSLERSNRIFIKAIKSGKFQLNSVCSSSAYQTEVISTSAYPSLDKIQITYGIKASTITPKKPKVADPKVNVPTAPGSNPGDLFRTSRDVDKEFEEMINNNNYMVILYNDPVNKRAYVQKVLMEVFNWDENKAMSVMMQAHTYGLAVTGEYYKELATEYAEQLLSKNLVAEAKPCGGGEDGGGERGE